MDARLAKAYDVTIKKYPTQNNESQCDVYFAFYEFQILCEISKASFEISHKIWNPYTAKCAFCEMLRS